MNKVCWNHLYWNQSWGLEGRAPSHQRPMGVRGRNPQRCGDFTTFFKKNTHFLGEVWSKFCVFKGLNKVLQRPQGLRPGVRATSCLPCYATGRKSKDSSFCYRYSITVFWP